MILDPPYDNTGCKHSYKVMPDKVWLDAIKFNDLIDDGLIFMWVTNGKLYSMMHEMHERGWEYSENITWNKYDRKGDHLRRGGYGLLHTHETCLVFKRRTPIKGLDKF